MRALSYAGRIDSSTSLTGYCTDARKVSWFRITGNEKLDSCACARSVCSQSARASGSSTPATMAGIRSGSMSGPWIRLGLVISLSRVYRNESVSCGMKP